MNMRFGFCAKWLGIYLLRLLCDALSVHTLNVHFHASVDPLACCTHPVQARQPYRLPVFGFVAYSGWGNS